MKKHKGNKTAKTTRYYRMDNYRALLICLVVFGHLLETFDRDWIASLTYRCIYTFHMPAFLFISGFFARSRPKSIPRKRLLPLVVFQILYLVFDHFMFHKEEPFSLQFTTPNWLLWYLLVLLYFDLILPIIKTKRSSVAITTLLACVALSLGVGFDNSIGYYMSLSRALVFLPFFVAGYYVASFSLKRWFFRHRLLIIFATGILAFLCEYKIYLLDVGANVFYGSVGYEALGSNCLIRLLFLICAFSCILFLFTLIPNKRLPIITGIGQRTLPIFLLHGFCQRMVLRYALLKGTPSENMLYAGLITAAIVIAFSREPLNRLFRKLF